MTKLTASEIEARIENLAAEVDTASDIESLCDTLNEIEDAFDDLEVVSGYHERGCLNDHVDITSLPLFGGPEYPEEGVYSWSDKYLLRFAASFSTWDARGRRVEFDRWYLQGRHLDVSVDLENNAAAWWDAARAASDSPPELAALLHGDDDTVKIDVSSWPAVLAWCEAIEGWDDGDARAPHPLTWEAP